MDEKILRKLVNTLWAIDVIAIVIIVIFLAGLVRDLLSITPAN
jgi:hypothetical protein